MIYEENIKLSAYALRTKPITYDIDENGCWICTSHSKTKDGYPKLKRNGKYFKLHRYVYEDKNGAIPKGYVVMHKCDNPTCFNLDHLKLGTQQENILDMMIKNRQAKGSQVNKGKLNESDVKKILADERMYKTIAEDYGVDPSTISVIKNNKTWKHVQEGY